MSGLKFYSYEGMGHQLLRDLGYSQAVRVAIELKSVVKVREIGHHALGSILM